GREGPAVTGTGGPQESWAGAVRRAASSPAVPAGAGAVRRAASSPAVPAGAGAVRRAASSPAVLVLEDGRVFHGRAYGAVGEAFGEAVFATGMTGYQETLTDPSYHRQVVVQTAPHIGNTGVKIGRAHV